MKLDEKLRPQNMADWRELFSGRTPMSALNRGAVDSEAPTRRAGGAPPAGVTPKASSAAVTTERASRSGLITRKRWKWLRRGAFIFVMVLAVAVFLKQRAMERDLQQRGAPQGQPSAELQRQVTQRFEAADAAGEMPFALKKEFIAADRDGNGYLSPDEVRGRFPAVDKNFSAVDANHDGRISLGELWEYRKEMFTGKSRRP